MHSGLGHQSTLRAKNENESRRRFMKFNIPSRISAIVVIALLSLSPSINGQMLSQVRDSKMPLRHHRYKLVDLGTFGGPQGYLNPEGNGGPYINDRGAVVGNTQTTTPLPPNADSFLCYPSPNINHAFEWRGHDTIDLGALSPSDYNCSDALAINDRGEAAGQSSNGVLDPQLGLTELRAVVWKDGEIRDLGTFGGNESGAGSINRYGQVAGYALNSIPDPYSLFGFVFLGSQNSTQTRAFIWQDGHKRDLGTLGGPDAQVYPGGSINDRGQVIGFSYTNSVPNATTGLPTLHPFFWDGRRMVDVGSLGGHFAIALGLNNRGEVIGNSLLSDDAASHPYFWSQGKMLDIGTFGGTQGEANAINENGEVAGDAYFPGDAIRHGFLWKYGKRRDLGVLPGDKCSAAWAINNMEQIIGNSGMCGFGIRAFLWEHGEIANLNDLVWPKSDVVLNDAIVIADNGEIGVNGLPPGCTDGDTCGHPYLLIPDGDCDDELSAKITASQSEVSELVDNPAVIQIQNAAADRTRSSVAAFLRDMRRRYHIPEHAIAPQQ
jgi:probable HAF family extracellular repeat protein